MANCQNVIVLTNHQAFHFELSLTQTAYKNKAKIMFGRPHEVQIESTIKDKKYKCIKIIKQLEF